MQPEWPKSSRDETLEIASLPTTPGRSQAKSAPRSPPPGRILAESPNDRETQDVVRRRGPDQLDKLDELAYTYKKRTGRRIDRQDIVRTLIDRCDLDTLIADG